MDIIDEESNFPKATVNTLATKLHNGPGVYKHCQKHISYFNKFTPDVCIGRGLGFFLTSQPG